MGDNDSLLGAGDVLSDHDSGVSSLAGDEQQDTGGEVWAHNRPPRQPTANNDSEHNNNSFSNRDAVNSLLLQALTAEVTGSQQRRTQVILGATAVPRPEADGEWAAGSLLELEQGAPRRMTTNTTSTASVGPKVPSGGGGRSATTKSARPVAIMAEWPTQVSDKAIADEVCGDTGADFSIRGRPLAETERQFPGASVPCRAHHFEHGGATYVANHRSVLLAVL